MIERIHKLESGQDVHQEKIENLMSDRDYVWETIDKIRDTVGTIRIQVAGIVAVGSVLQILITSWIVYKITKG